MSSTPRVLILIFAAFATASFGGAFAHADILHEQGTLRGLLGGSCPDCVYDNWISHISEGIARNNYNDYGPVSLDPQLDGFGSFIALADTGTGDSPIDKWYNIFTAFFAADTQRVDSLLTAASLDSVYDLVVFADTTRVYYILREHLNLAYYDDQRTPADSTDDVRGSFSCGWGIYVFAPEAARGNVLIEAPHPEDDFVTPWIATDIFQSWNAGGLMIAGAGREVLWTEQGTYDNTKSLSDPSRVSSTVFHAAHRAFVDAHADDFTLQLHSYDSETHPNRKSLVVSAGADDSYPNEPILDRCAYNDMISFTPYIAVPANLCGNHPNVTIGNYYSLFYEGGYEYQGTSPTISQNNDLGGYGQNRQMQYSHAGHDDYNDPENFVHIEMDEMPDAIQDSVGAFYLTALPGGVTFANYQHALDYFRPAYVALLQSLELPPMETLLQPNPTLLNIGSVAVHQTESRWEGYQNVSASDTLHIEGATLPQSVFSLSNVPTNLDLIPGAVCSLRVSFTPNSATTYSSILSLRTNRGCSHIEVRGSGSGAALTLTPDSLGFDTLAVGVRDTLTLNCHNDGNSTLLISGFVSSSPSAHVLFASDSTISGHANATIKVEFRPLDAGAAICSVGVVSNAYNADTAWVSVTGFGSAIPQAVNGVVISFVTPGSIQLCWPRSDSTATGFPLFADGYQILAHSTMGDPSTLIGTTSDTCFVHSEVVNVSLQHYYTVIAYYSNIASLSAAVFYIAPPLRRD